MILAYRWNGRQLSGGEKSVLFGVAIFSTQLQSRKAVASMLENGSTDQYRSAIIRYMQDAKLHFQGAHISQNAGPVLIGTFRAGFRRNLLDAKDLDASTDIRDRYLAGGAG